MSFIQRFLLGNRVDDDLQVGLFLKNDGTVWLRNPDGSETQVTGGGAGGNPGQQRFQGQDVTIPSSSRLELTWDNPSGDGLLDATSPTDPQIIAAGLYAFNLNVRGDSNLTAGANYDVEVTVASPSFDVNATSAEATDTEQAPDVVLSPVWYCDAGAVINASVLNNDSGDGDWFLNAYIQKLA